MLVCGLVSFMFSSRSFPGPLQCSNDMCRRKHPRAFLSDAGKVCKHCGGRDFNVGKQTDSEDKGTSSSQPNLSFLDRYYFQKKEKSDDNRHSFSQTNTPSLDSYSQSSDEGHSEDKDSNLSQPNLSFLHRYYLKREKVSSENNVCSYSQSSDKGGSQDKGCSASPPNPCLVDHYLQREKGLHVDKRERECAVFPQPLTTAEYMSRVQEVQRGRQMLTMEEYFREYMKQ